MVLWAGRGYKTKSGAVDSVVTEQKTCCGQGLDMQKYIHTLIEAYWVLTTATQPKAGILSLIALRWLKNGDPRLFSLSV